MDDVNIPSNPVETTMTKTLRTLSLVELLNAALLIGLGILLIWWPGLTLRSLVIFCGAFLLVESVSTMIGAWHAIGLLRWIAGIIGVIGVALGLLVLLLPGLTLSFIAVAVGLWTIVSGIALMARKATDHRWLHILGGLLLVLAGGWFVIDHTAAIITIGLWAGMMLLAIGATQAAAAIAVWRAAKNS